MDTTNLQRQQGIPAQNTPINRQVPVLDPDDQQVSTVSANAPTEFQQEIMELAAAIDQDVAMPEELRRKAKKMISRLERGAKYGNFSKDYEELEKYIEWVTQIPWGKYTEDNLDLKNAHQVLDETHYGLQKVKNLILEYISVMNFRKQEAIKEGDLTANNVASYKAPIVLFVGLQGVGKTSIAKSIAKAMNREIVRIALGAMSNISQIRGLPRSEVNAEPGQVVKALIRAKTMNPIIILDEIDKVSGQEGKAADMNAVLLEILDPEQNNKFLDYYVDYHIDLSKVMFICTANNLGTLSAALLDRLEIIRFTSYTDDEKLVIAKTYLWPKVLKASGLAENQVSFQEEVWAQLIRPLGFDSGIRQLERTLMGVARKAAKKMLEEGANHIAVTTENVKYFLPDDLGTLS